MDFALLEPEWRVLSARIDWRMWGLEYCNIWMRKSENVGGRKVNCTGFKERKFISYLLSCVSWRLLGYQGGAYFDHCNAFSSLPCFVVMKYAARD